MAGWRVVERHELSVEHDLNGETVESEAAIWQEGQNWYWNARCLTNGSNTQGASRSLAEAIEDAERWLGIP